MFTRVVGALERIQYQYQSPLFKDVTKLCQDAIDAIRLRSDVSTASGSILQAKVEKILSKIDFAGRLRTIVRTRLNLTLSEVYIVPDSADQAAIANGFRLKKNVVLYRHPYFYNQGARSTLTDEWRNFVNVITSNVDSVSGSIRADISQYFDSMLWLTTGCFTLGKIYANSEDLTAEEIAAIILHELGHAMTFLESFCLVVEKTLRLKEIIEAIKTKLNGTNLDDFRKALIAEITKIEDPQTREAVSVVLSRLNEKTEFTRDQALAIYATSLVALGFAGACYDSGLSNTDLQNSHFERITDEFMSQHGAGAAMVSGFVKSYTAYEKGRSQRLIDLMAASQVINLLVEQFSFISSIMKFSLVISLSSSYDPLLRRLKLCVENMTENLKDSTLAPEIRQELVEIIRKGRATLDEYENRDYVKRREWFWKTVFRLGRPGIMLDALTNGNLAADYQRLQEMTKDLVQSPFSYQRARLQNLLDTVQS